MPTLTEIETAVYDALLGKEPKDRAAARIADEVWKAVVAELQPATETVSRPFPKDFQKAKGDKKIGDHVRYNGEAMRYEFHVSVAVRGKPIVVQLHLLPPVERTGPEATKWRLTLSGKNLVDGFDSDTEQGPPHESMRKAAQNITTEVQVAAIKALAP